MKQAESYRVDAQIGQITINPLPQGQLDITFRIGRHSITQTVLVSTLTPHLQLATQLTFHIDRPPHNQRSSIVLHIYRNSDRQVLAIGPLTLPKGNNHSQKVYKLAQCHDKNAQMSVSLNITPVHQQIELIHRVSSNQLMEAYNQRLSTNIDEQTKHNLQKTPKNNHICTPIKQKNSLNKILEKEGIDQHESIQYKLASQQDTLQSVIEQVKRFRTEKQAYYQLYQIEKHKNEVANHFITELINKIVKKYPTLAHIIPNASPTHNYRPKQTDSPNYNKLLKAYQQLEQANRSMHRQMALYKNQIDSLNIKLAQDTPRSSYNPFHFKSPSRSSLLPRQLLDIASPRSNSMQHYSVIPPPTPNRFHPPSLQLTQQELQRWLSKSITQGQQLRQLLHSLPRRSSNPQPKINLTKLKTNINQSILTLLQRKTLTKQHLLAHKLQLNKLIDALHDS